MLCATCSLQPDSRRSGFRHLNALLTFSLLISEDFWVFLSFLSDRSLFSTFVGLYKNTAIAEKREENPEILTN